MDADDYYDDWSEFCPDCGEAPCMCRDWEEDWGDPCSRCGPWCDEWAGDGLCNIAIRQHAQDEEDYYAKFVREGVNCPVCGDTLTQFEVPVSELWTWPGDFYNPLIALGIYAAYGAPKGEIHRSKVGGVYEVCHVWIGLGDSQEEKLIKLTGGER